MNLEKLIGSISIIITIFIGIIMFISGFNWINAMHTGDSKQGMWLFITITCVVILLVNMISMDILDYMKYKDKHVSIEYANKKKAYIAAGLLITGGLIATIFTIVLIYILALIPMQNLEYYIYPMVAIIWIGIILVFIGFIYETITNAFKAQQPNNKEDPNSN